MHRLFLGVLLLAQQATPQCGGATAFDQNTVALTVNLGPTHNETNIAFVAVTLCVAGQPSNCQTIEDVMVDTGSTGLRILSSALSVNLQPQTTSSGGVVVECFPFQDGFTWGPVATADVRIGAKQASAVPVQIIGAVRTPSPPDGCTSNGLASEDTVETLGGNGVLGVGIFRQDCGLACTFTGSSNPDVYYACSTSGCQVTSQPLPQQVQNPVWMFASDNNGVVIQLPAVPAEGEPAASGLLVFGIGTQSNNRIGSATVLTLDADGNFATAFAAKSTAGFIDSGSNGYYFLDAVASQIPVCSDDTDFYCPTETLSLSATNIGANGKSGPVSFSVANADASFEAADAVLPEIAGPFPGHFDWGLPFFYGRSVYTAIEGQATPGGLGPYFAY